MDKYLIAGLGNPGRTYLETRHNAGFLLIDRLVEAFSADGPEDRGNHLAWNAEIHGHEVCLIKPLTYMNVSGAAVASSATVTLTG